MNYKLLLTTSWTWSRLWDLTKDTNKSLLTVWGKIIASHIIDIYPDDIDLIITVWYCWDQVETKIKELYPTRNITFVKVSPYEGPGSSLWFSMLQAKDFLQCPFIFHACDTIIPKNALEPSFNWTLWYKAQDSTPYTTFNIWKNWTIKNYNKWKWAKVFDFAHIWVCGIYNYKEFWEILENLYESNSNDTSLNDVSAISCMIETWIEFKYFEEKNWLDTWSINGLEEANKILSSNG